MNRPLLQRWPMLAETLPWTALGELPTPLQPVAPLADELGLASLTLKRDDISAVRYGGNKVRKLELLLPDAAARGCTAVMTYGGLGSNHALATALYARQFGLRCGAVLTPEPITPAVRRTLQRHQALGTELVLAANYGQVPTAAAGLTEQLGGSARCADIPFGGSNWLGTLGFVNAALELAGQVAARELPAPDIIYVGCGTAGTAAGLALGLELTTLTCQLHGVQVTPDSMRPAALAHDLYVAARRELGQRVSQLPAVGTAPGRLVIRNDQLGAGYAQPTPAAREAQQRLEAATGLPLSLTYTAKAMAALLNDARAGHLADRHVVFWNTYNSQDWTDPDTGAERPLPADIAALLG